MERGRSSKVGDHERSAKKSRLAKSANAAEDLIPNYDQMTPAERVKARMNLQLSQAETKDKNKNNKHWERFDFDATAPLDEEQPKTVVDDDDDTTSLRDTTGSYFSYSSQVMRENRTEAAHDAAMFGAPTNEQSNAPNSPEEGKDREKTAANELLSKEVIAMQNDTWQERLRKLKAAKAATAAATPVT